MFLKLTSTRTAFVACSALLVGACVESTDEGAGELSNGAEIGDAAGNGQAQGEYVVIGEGEGLEVATPSGLASELTKVEVEFAAGSVERRALENWGVSSPVFYHVSSTEDLPADATLTFSASDLAHAQVLRWNEESGQWESQTAIRRDALAGELSIAEAGNGLYALVKTAERFDSRFATQVWDTTSGKPMLSSRNSDEIMFEESQQPVTNKAVITSTFYINNVALNAGESVCLHIEGEGDFLTTQTNTYRYRADVSLTVPDTFEYYYYRSPDACTTEGTPLNISPMNNVVGGQTITLCEPRTGAASESSHFVALNVSGVATNQGTNACVSASPIVTSGAFRVDRVFPAGGDVVCAEVEGGAATELFLTNAGTGRYTRYLPVTAPSTEGFRYFTATGSCAGAEVDIISTGLPASNTTTWLNNASLSGPGNCVETGGSWYYQASVDAAGAATQTAGSENCPNRCGNGVTWDGEQCDDGNTNDTDTCSNSCTFNDQCDTNPCFPGVTCTGDEISFTCGACPSGTTGDGITCNDIDECAAETDNCSESAACLNDFGTFGCACLPGFAGDGETCTENGFDFIALVSDANASANVTVAMAALGFNGTVYTDPSAFNTAYDLDTFDVAIVSWSNSALDAGVESRLSARAGLFPTVVYVEQLSAGLQADFDVTLGTGGMNLSVRNSATSHINLLEQAEILPANVLFGEYVAVTPAPGFTVLRGGSPTTGIPAFAITNAGVSAVSGLAFNTTADTDSDTVVDAAELLANAVRFLTAERVLSYDEANTFSSPSEMPAAVRSLGLAHIRVSDSRASKFLAALTDYTGMYDIVAVDAPTISVARVAGTDTALTSWVTGGNPLVLMDWNLHNYTGLKAALGLTTATYNTPEDLFDAESGAVSVFSSYELLPFGINSQTVAVATYGATITNATSAESSGVIDSSATVIGVYGNVIINGINSRSFAAADDDSDSIPDIRELWINELAIAAVADPL